MIINDSIIAEGITANVLARLLERHGEGIDRLKKLKEYYLGHHAILSREKATDGAANNRIVCNHAKYIVDMTLAYLIGTPVTYAAAQGHDIEPLKNAYFEQDIASVDADIVKNMSIYGRAYELVYAAEDSKPRSVYLSPENTFVCYGQTAVKRPLLGVYYYNEYDFSGRVTGVVCDVYDDSHIYHYRAKDASFNSLVLEGTEQHYFGAVPIIEYDNDPDRQGDFEQCITLMDAYNTLQSDRVNDKEQFVEAFLFLKDIEVDSEGAKKLKKEKILLGYSEADAEYLSKVMSESDVDVLRQTIKEDIHRFSMIPDISDEAFAGNLSGVAIKYKLLGFEQTVKNKERYISKSLKRRFELYNSYLVLLGKMKPVPLHRVDVIFTHNLPANELETAQMINYLEGICSNETLLDQLSFVTDAKEENEHAKQDRETEHIDKVKGTADIYEYNN